MMTDALAVSCPDCLARKGAPCVYLWPKNWDGTPQVKYHYLSPNTLAKMEKAGTPMTRFHNGRLNKARLKQQVATRKAQDAEYAARNAAGDDREAILRANADAVIDEHRQLTEWLIQHAALLIGANR